MKIGVIGAGMVGKEVFHYLFHFSAATELVLVDLNKERAEAEILDFSDTLSLKYYNFYKKISFGDFSDLKDCHIIVINVSIKQTQPGRNSLAEGNKLIMKSLSEELKKHAKDSFVVITSNPVDSMTYYFLEHSGFNPSKVISAGTLLDTMRLHTISAQYYGISETSVSGFVLGEHGPTAFIPWSTFRIAGISKTDFESLNEFSPLDEKAILEEVVARGGKIFKKRSGYTDHGIGASICKIVNGILQDEKIILPVGTFLSNFYGLDDVVLSMPCIIGKYGIEKILDPHFSETEKEALQKSYQEVRSIIELVR